MWCYPPLVPKHHPIHSLAGLCPRPQSLKFTNLSPKSAYRATAFSVTPSGVSLASGKVPFPDQLAPAHTRRSLISRKISRLKAKLTRKRVTLNAPAYAFRVTPSGVSLASGEVPLPGQRAPTHAGRSLNVSSISRKQWRLKAKLTRKRVTLNAAPSFVIHYPFATIR
jgi:uncharacterized small protein (DUF1192 family)